MKSWERVRLNVAAGVLWPLLGVFIMSLGVGCGKVRRAPAPAASAAPDPELVAEARNFSTNPARVLDFRLVEEGDVEGFPKAGASELEGRSANEMLVDGHQVDFRDVIHLNSKKLFLVWRGNPDGVQIISAIAAHQKFTVLNAPTRNATRKGATYDTETESFFVALDEEFLGEPLADVSPSSRHEVLVELLLADQTKMAIKVIFRAAGPLPQLKLERRPGVALPRNAPELSAAWLQPVVLGQEKLTNPAGRDLKIWIRSSSEVKISTHLQSISHPGASDAPPPAAEIQKLSSEASVPVSLALEGSHSNYRRIEDWVSFVLPAKGEVTLVWNSEPAARCALPVPVTRVFNWQGSERCGRPRGGEGGDYCWFPEYSEQRVDSFQVVGVTVSGAWAREIRVTDPSMPEELATAAGRLSGEEVRVLEYGSQSISERVGTVWPEHSGAAPTSCLGGWT